MLSHYLSPSHPWADRIHHFDCVESTNTLAKEMAKQGAPHGTVLIAHRQTAGRGRLGRSFLSPAGQGIYMSVILRYQCNAEDLMHLTCACGVSLCNAMESALHIRPGIKWINDLVVDRKKLAGILVELVFTGKEICAIVGMGINCCQQLDDFDPSIRSIATSIAMITGASPNCEQLAAAILEQLAVMDTQLLSHRDLLLEQYRRDCITLGQQICVLQNDVPAYGQAIGIGTDGALLVRFEDGSERAINSGEVSIRGMYGYV